MSSSDKGGPDLSFSSSSEIKSFVRTQMDSPGYKGGESAQAGGDQIFRRTFRGTYTTLDGTDVASSTTYLQQARGLLFRSVFNPVDYNSSIRLELEEAYKTNELGFFITLTFVGTVAWSMFTYRRNSLLV